MNDTTPGSSTASTEARKGHGRSFRILMFPCTYTWLNTGDVSMLQVAVSRLGEIWPAVSIQMPTRNEESLRRQCSGVRALPWGDWFANHFLLGRIHSLIPARASKALVTLKQRIGERYPRWEQGAIRLKLRLQGRNRGEFRRWVRAAREADAVVVSGAGGLSDTFPSFTIAVLRTLETAIRRGQSTAMFGHGFGPLKREDLRDLARRVLPRVDLIALREKRSGEPLLRELGVDMARTIVTGDDAIEIAYGERTDQWGYGLGVNVRTGIAAGVDDRFLDALRLGVADFVRETGAPVIPVPIAWQHNWDMANIDRLTAGMKRVESPEQDLSSTRGICRQVGHCRIVLAGAYHAAVFAMSQGIPTVALANSEYYVSKFLGLADMFGAGCELVMLGEPELERRVGDALRRAWVSAAGLREPLREAAREQIRNSRDAYARFGEIAAARGRAQHAPTSPLAPGLGVRPRFQFRSGGQA